MEGMALGLDGKCKVAGRGGGLKIDFAVIEILVKAPSKSVKKREGVEELQDSLN